MPRPSLSVIVPAYNCQRTIAESLETVLAQTPPDAEVLVIDDGSTDGTVVAANMFAPLVRVICAPHRGIDAAFNYGVRASSGMLIGSIDPGDLWLPGKLERQLAALHADRAIGGVFGFVRQYLPPALTSQKWRFALSTQPRPGTTRGVLLLRREAWDRVGELETSLNAGAFVSWYARAVAAGVTMQMIPDVVYEQRVQETRASVRAKQSTR